MKLKVTQGHKHWRQMIERVRLLLVTCNNHVLVMRDFRDITTCTLLLDGNYDTFLV